MNITLERVYESLMDLKTTVGTIKNDISWIKEEVQEIKINQVNCQACKNSIYIIKQTNTNRDDIDNLKKNEHIIIGISIAASGIVSLIIALVTVYLKLRTI